MPSKGKLINRVIDENLAEFGEASTKNREMIRERAITGRLFLFLL
jgi:hypothetical protein